MSRTETAAGRRVSTERCPLSVIDGKTWALADEFLARKLAGEQADVSRLPAKSVDAFVALECEWRAMEGRRDGESASGLG